MNARDELFEALMPMYRSQYAPGEEESTNLLLDAYASEVRAAALREAADRVSQVATEMRNGEWSEELTSREVRDAVEGAAYAVRRMAEEGQ